MCCREIHSMLMINIALTVRLYNHRETGKNYWIKRGPMPKTLPASLCRCLRVNFGKFFRMRNTETITQTFTELLNIHIITWGKLF